MGYSCNLYVQFSYIYARPARARHTLQFSLFGHEVEARPWYVSKLDRKSVTQ
jgi:hypothetical protein